MASYLVMKTNFKRLLHRKSTYLFMILIPLFISMIALFSTIKADHKLTIALIGDQSKFQDFEDAIQSVDQQHQLIRIDRLQVMNEADYIMGKYDYMLSDQNDPCISQILSRITVDEGQRTPESSSYHSLAAQCIAMLCSAYIIIATYYSSDLIKDRKQGIMERYCSAGKSKLQFIGGYMMSTAIMCSLQIILILTVWNLFLSDYHLDLQQNLIAFIFILIFANVISSILTFISRSDLQSGLLASVFAMVLLLFSGTLIPYEQMPAVLQRSAVVNPIRWLVTLL